jgi:hypothetical protein
MAGLLLDEELNFATRPCRHLGPCFNEKSGPSQRKIRTIFKIAAGQAAISRATFLGQMRGPPWLRSEQSKAQ